MLKPPYLSEREIAELSARMGPERLQKRLAEERAKLVWSEREQRYKVKIRPYRAMFLIFGRLLKILGLYNKGLANAARPKVIFNEIIPPRWPIELDGLRLLHLSDLHLDSNPKLMPLVREMTKTLTFDLAVITGDITSTPPGTGWREQFALLPSAMQCPLGAFAVLGNHDSIGLAPILEKEGIRFLLNENIILTVAKRKIGLAGVDDSGKFKTDDLAASLRFNEQPDAVILLSHSPGLSERAARGEADLYLCGHTHAGQICPLPGMPLMTMTAAPRERAAGNWLARRMRGYTSAGTGSSAPPIRFNCPPEITIHILKSPDVQPAEAELEPA